MNSAKMIGVNAFELRNIYTGESFSLIRLFTALPALLRNLGGKRKENSKSAISKLFESLELKKQGRKKKKVLGETTEQEARA